ncbi:MAG: MMPL family transporter [Chloroflexota bacterium]|nr:MMPL family transporter [Chloroflexota bacterium]
MFTHLGRIVARFAPLVVVAWLLAVVGVSLVLVPRFTTALTGPPLQVRGSDSARAQKIITERFGEPFAEQDLVVFTSASLTTDDPEFRAVVTDALERLRPLPGVVSITSPYDPGADTLIAKDRQMATAIVAITGTNAERQALVPRLTARATAASTPYVTVYVTGSSPLIAELVAQEQADLSRAEQLGLPIAALVLLITSGTVIAAGLPILLAMTGMAMTFGILGAASMVTEFNLFVPNIATMIGLGVGIDYALFIVNRFREELASGRTPEDAVVVTMTSTGKNVFFSGMIVLVSLSGLLLVNARIFHELALGAMTAVAVMLFGAMTFLPALLAWLGPRVNSLRLPGRPANATGIGGWEFWGRWARAIMRHPGFWATLAVAILLILSSPILRLNLSLDTSTPEGNEGSAGAGRKILEQEFNEGLISPLQVVYVSRDGALDQRDLDAIAQLSRSLTSDWAVVDVISVTTLLDQYTGGHSVDALTLAANYPQVVAAAGDVVNFTTGMDVAVIRAVPRWSPDSPGPLELVGRVRNRMGPEALAGLPAEMHVGGLSAQIVDISAESRHKLPVVAGTIVVVSMLLLMMVFRSIVLPLKAILMNVLGITAAYGLLVVVFQDGAGARLLKFTPTGSIQVYLPLLTFAVLFGISMDYEVFLLGRIKEEWDKSGNNQEAVVKGVQRTASVITAAAAIMVAVFTAFTLAQLMEVKELGFSLAAAVFIDATLIRIVLVPAAMQLLGDRNWWLPGWLDRLLPRINLSEDAGASSGAEAPGP